MKKKALGRPTKMTPLRVKKLEEAFAFGCTDAEACFYAGISKQCLYNYQDKNPEFVDRKEALKQRPVLLARRSVIDGLPKDPSLALKYLERKKKDEFSPKATIDVREPAKAMSPEDLRAYIKDVVSRATPEQLARYGLTGVAPDEVQELPGPPLQIEDAKRAD